MLESINDFVAITDLDGTIMFFARTVPGVGMKELKGFPLGTTVYEMAAPDHQDAFRESFERVVRTGMSQSFEMTGLISGSWYAGYLVPIHHDGHVTATMAIATEVTQAQLARAPLRDSGERPNGLPGAGLDGIVIHETGSIVTANEVFATMFGYEPSEVTGMHALDFAAPESRDGMLRGFLRADDKPFETVGLRKDGSTVRVAIRGMKLTLGGRRVWMASIRDVTQRRQAEKAPELLREEARGPAQAAVRAYTSERTANRLPSLSDRELEVLALVAQGLSNRQIAAWLSISKRTVDHHVSHILTKLGASNRTAAASAAARSEVLRGEPLAR